MARLRGRRLNGQGAGGNQPKEHEKGYVCPSLLLDIYFRLSGFQSSLLFIHFRCYSDMGIPIPNTLVTWASPSHITLAIWVRVGFRVTGDAHITVTPEQT